MFLRSRAGVTQLLYPRFKTEGDTSWRRLKIQLPDKNAQVAMSSLAPVLLALFDAQAILNRRGLRGCARSRMAESLTRRPLHKT